MNLTWIFPKRWPVCSCLGTVKVAYVLRITWRRSNRASVVMIPMKISTGGTLTVAELSNHGCVEQFSRHGLRILSGLSMCDIENVTIATNVANSATSANASGLCLRRYTPVRRNSRVLSRIILFDPGYRNGFWDDSARGDPTTGPRFRSAIGSGFTHVYVELDTRESLWLTSHMARITRTPFRILHRVADCLQVYARSVGRRGGVCMC